jgi:tetratricopeptide (TPR) repeat protein
MKSGMLNGEEDSGSLLVVLARNVNSAQPNQHPISYGLRLDGKSVRRDWYARPAVFTTCFTLLLCLTLAGCVAQQSRVTAYMHRGRLYFMNDLYDNAIREYTKAIAFSPNNVEAYCERAGVYLLMGDDDMAIGDLDQSIAIDPQCAMAYLRRGQAYFAKGDNTRALADATTALSISPDYADAFAARALFWVSPNKLEEARADLKRCQELHGYVPPELLKLLPTESQGP